MSITLTVEERLSILEKDMAALKHGKPVAQTKGNWLESIAGTFKDDPEFGEILRLGREIRKSATTQDELGRDTCS